MGRTVTPGQPVLARIRATFDAAGVSGWLHAVDIDRASEVELRADEPVVLASVFKVPLVVAFFRAAEDGRLDPRAPVTVPLAERSGGPTGIAAMLDPVTISLRDLAYLALTVSDNAAADVLADHVGLDNVAETLDALGLHRTRVPLLTRDVAALTREDLDEQRGLVTDPAAVSRLRVLDPLTSNRSTARDCTRLLALIWRDEAAGPASCGAIRRLLSLQVWPHRLASGFPFDDVSVAGKTGTLPTIRNEIGVVEYPDGGRYAVAVFTRSTSTALNLPRADAAIGLAARLAVEHLREQSSD
ncbi:serine hydrolase [Rugosimonospora acidiphila]|uniref:Serine hydrolase n=1 Tax=Rugosimonospora acidiphila TaxID=556531 RepID=A0ABP9RVF7_9ACTN